MKTHIKPIVIKQKPIVINIIENKIKLKVSNQKVTTNVVKS